MKGFKPIINASLFAFLIAGCNSGDDNVEAPSSAVTDSSSIAVSAPKYDNLTVNINPNEAFDGEINVYLGKWFSCSDEHPEYCDGTLNKLTIDDSKYAFKIKTEELKNHFVDSISKEYLREGFYSVLDALLYVSDISDVIDIQVGDFDESIGTYKVTTSFDANGDGVFSIAGDGKDNYKNQDWYFRFLYHQGDFAKEAATPAYEAAYLRAEQFVLRDGINIRFEKFDPEVTKRRQYLQKKEVDRLDENNGKIIISEVKVNYDDGRGLVTIANNVEVKPYNLRPDLFNDNVVTAADVLMTLDQELGQDISFTFWPEISTSTKVNSYAVTSVNGLGGGAMSGWSIYSGEAEAAKDFYGREYTLEQILSAPTGTYCAWMGELTPELAEVCRVEYSAKNGGYALHLMSDITVMKYPTEIVTLSFGNRHAGRWKITEANNAADGKFTIYDLDNAAHSLDENHFGWGIADCGLCHSIDNIHLQGDSPNLPDNVEPYYCASCHNSNGAPKGHGETARCFWCHSENKKMEHHGDASMYSFASDINCSGDIAGQTGPCSNLVDSNPIRDKAMNPTEYSESLVTRGNSDWYTSESFPDPYSCITCHPN